MRIGIFGGSFDPVHLGHIELAKIALKELHLSKLYFVPASRSPLRTNYPFAKAEHRVAMLKRALQGKKRFRISMDELRRRGPSYTFDTIIHFHKKFPKDKLFLIMGNDALSEFNSWKSWKEILRYCFLSAAKRRDSSRSQNIPKGNIRWLKSAAPQISSTIVRRQIEEDKLSSNLIPDAVLSYIRKHRLYRK